MLLMQSCVIGAITGAIAGLKVQVGRTSRSQEEKEMQGRKEGDFTAMLWNVAHSNHVGSWGSWGL